MCSFCVIVSRFALFQRGDLFDIRFRPFHRIDSLVDPSIASMGIAHNHLQAPVAGEILDGRNIGAAWVTRTPDPPIASD